MFDNYCLILLLSLSLCQPTSPHHSFFCLGGVVCDLSKSDMAMYPSVGNLMPLSV